MTKSMLAAALVAAALATPAFAQQAQGSSPMAGHQTCLQIGRIWSWHAPDDHSLIVENDNHQKFKLDLMGYCPGLRFKETIGFKSIGGTELSCISAGDYIFFRDEGMRSRCSIQKVSPYTAEMEKADKAKKEEQK
jgi:hypothetical protein